MTKTFTDPVLDQFAWDILTNWTTRPQTLVVKDKDGYLKCLADLVQFADLIKQHLISEGYRKCAEGQSTTQYCGQLEAAVKAEREACANLADSEADDAYNVPSTLTPTWGGNSDGLYASRNIAAAIRARGK